jgi:hypothetical protein
MGTEMIWTARSKNTKTGDIPQGNVGQTIEKAKASCEGCPILSKCYHWTGSSQLGHISMTKGYVKRGPEAYTLEAALAKAARSAKYARGAVGGDPNVFSKETVKGWFKAVKDAGLKGLLLYTHFAKTKGAHLKGLAMASCNIDEADELVELGWRAAAILPFKAPRLSAVKTAMLKDIPEYPHDPKLVRIRTKEGRPVIVCPAQYDVRTTCNDCGLCDASRHANNKSFPIIGFLQH